MDWLCYPLATEGVSTNLCVHEHIKMLCFQRLNLWQTGLFQRIVLKSSIPCIFWSMNQCYVTTQILGINFIYIQDVSPTSFSICIPTFMEHILLGLKPVDYNWQFYAPWSWYTCIKKCQIYVFNIYIWLILWVWLMH